MKDIGRFVAVGACAREGWIEWLVLGFQWAVVRSQQSVVRDPFSVIHVGSPERIHLQLATIIQGIQRPGKTTTSFRSFN
jgi:hypothetical protein